MGRSSTRGRTFPPEPLSPAEVSALLSACSLRAPTGIRDHALIMLLYRSGLRINEALSLRPFDLDFHQHKVRLLTTKAGEAQTRGFHSSADVTLARWLDTRKILAGLKTAPLFCTLHSGPLSDRQVRNMLKRRAARAGIGKRVHPHGLRHTFAVELRESGADIAVISKLLGHTSIAHTARYLDHLTNGDAISRLQALVLPGQDQ